MKKKITLSCVSICASVLILELMFRFSNMAPRIYRLLPEGKETSFIISDNPKLGYEMKKNFRSETPDHHKIFSYTNSHGFRDIERDINKAADIKRIMLLGDSIVAGHGIADIENTISRVLEKRINNPKIEVLNFGIGGYCNDGEMELLEKRGLEFKPDIVILLFVANDYYEGNQLMRNYELSRPAIIKWLFLNSDLCRYVFYTFNFYHFNEMSRLKKRSEQLETIEEVTNFVRKDYSSRRYKDTREGPDNNVVIGMNRFKEMSEQHEFEKLIFIWPAFEETIFDRHPHIWKPRDGKLAVQNIADDLGFELFYLSNFFDKDWQDRIDNMSEKVKEKQSPKDLYTIGDTMHPNEYGAEFTAEIIYQILLSRKML